MDKLSNTEHFLLIAKEAILIGLVLIPLTYAAGYVAKRVVQKPSLPEVCSTWNQNYIMEWNVFLAGLLLGLLLHLARMRGLY